MVKRPLRIGHRGAAGSAPENTLASFGWAVTLGADAVEVDVRRSKDGALVVMHDDTVDRTTDGTGRVAELTLKDLRKLDAGAWMGRTFMGLRVPTVEEVATALPERIELFLELKAGSSEYPGIEEDVVRLLRQRNFLARVRVSSFDQQALIRLHELHPGLRIGALFDEPPTDAVSFARGCGANAIHPDFRYLDPKLVSEAHRAGLAVFAWTVNEPTDIARVRSMGVDGIMSDYPDRLA